MSEAKKLYCKPCGKYMGEVRDGSLRKGMTVLCELCERKRALLEMVKKYDNQYEKNDALGSIFPWAK